MQAQLSQGGCGRRARQESCSRHAPRSQPARALGRPQRLPAGPTQATHTRRPSAAAPPGPAARPVAAFMRARPAAPRPVRAARVVAMAKSSMQFIKGIDEPVIPEVKLTRSRDGSSGIGAPAGRAPLPLPPPAAHAFGLGRSDVLTLCSISAGAARIVVAKSARSTVARCIRSRLPTAAAGTSAACVPACRPCAPAPLDRPTLTPAATFIFQNPAIFEASSELGDITGLYMTDDEGTLQVGAHSGGGGHSCLGRGRGCQQQPQQQCVCRHTSRCQLCSGARSWHARTHGMRAGGARTGQGRVPARPQCQVAPVSASPHPPTTHPPTHLFVQTVDVQAKFVNGKPDKIEVKYVMRSEFEWARFLR